MALADQEGEGRHLFFVAGRQPLGRRTIGASGRRGACRRKDRPRRKVLFGRGRTVRTGGRGFGWPRHGSWWWGGSRSVGAGRGGMHTRGGWGRRLPAQHDQEEGYDRHDNQDGIEPRERWTPGTGGGIRRGLRLRSGATLQLGEHDSAPGALDGTGLREATSRTAQAAAPLSAPRVGRRGAGVKAQHRGPARATRDLVALEVVPDLSKVNRLDEDPLCSRPASAGVRSDRWGCSRILPAPRWGSIPVATGGFSFGLPGERGPDREDPRRTP